MPHLWRSTLLRGLGLFAILFAALLAAAAYFPTFEENAPLYKTLAVIPTLKEILNVVEEGGVWGYMAGQQYFKGCNTMGVAAAILFAVGAVAGESERGTLEVWLGRPVSRDRLLLERWLGGALAVCVPVFASSYAMNWMMDFSEVDSHFSYTLLTLASAHQCALLLAIYSATFFLSVIGDQPHRITFGMLFFNMGMFSMYMIESITKWSLFRLADPSRYLTIQRNMSLEGGVVYPLLAVTAGFLGLSLWRFRQRVP